ncbi:hypothetical protein FHX08_004792 [Rhizobium sp. BK529]|uniref:DUF1376 domain-containing protein n=1 Tax=Rhizobium sp. BK529 TaxID=2586983 RepID=UPI00160B20DC|nr:DUF1376 domain-containing protein [Rhizobium sp. BK529]MBB3594388.1 hypothetical protein [Rhizobium sp. BK529]
MPSGKARRVDFYCDEYIAGVAGKLTAEEQGVYWMICALIMSEGGPVDDNPKRLSSLCLNRPADIRRVIQSLVEKGKIYRQSDAKLCQNRAQSEVERSLKRIQTASEVGSKGGRPKGKSEKNQGKAKAEGSSGEKLTNNYQLATNNHQPLKEVSDDTSLDARAAFDRFWEIYPKKSDKRRAEGAFVKALQRADLETILSAVLAYAGERRGKDQQFTKNAATWLNGDCWANPVGQAPANSDWRDDPAYAGVDV